MSLPLYVENAKFIAKILEALNQLPSTEDFYLHVELRETHTDQVVGTFSDEIAPDAWSFTARSD